MFRILVCEYKTYNHPVIRRMLESRGHSVTMAPSLKEALAIFWEQPNTFDLLLIDVVDSENDLSWVNAVRKVRPNILLLMVSAYLGEGFRPPDCGLYLPKPFTTGELADAIAELNMPVVAEPLTLPEAA
jgi:CheY-like chemotaxis protein